ncbi:MAG TPA: hypothetical protein VHS78_09440 [Candidatus Elarobacter sp.]|jgi:DNA-binding IclR family transcriptional regulator|nr:hypothetical protein [Candidatus Elarobacter sp.]
MTLAVNDRPLYVTELAAMLDTWHSKVDQALVPLEAAGIVASRLHNPSLRWVGLNTAFPAYTQALRLLRSLEESWPQRRAEKPRRRAERLALSPLRATPGRKASLPSSDRLEAAQTDKLFYSVPGSRALLAIAAMGQTDVTDLYQTVGLGRKSVWNIANRWQREGLIRSVRSGRRRVLELDPDFPAAQELRRFLLRLVAVTEEYEALASLSIRHSASPRFTSTK